MTPRTSAQIRPDFGGGPGGGWLSVREAAEVVGVHPSTLRRWSNERRLESHRTAGGHRRYRRSQLQSLVETRPRLRAFGGLSNLWMREVDRWIHLHRPFLVEGRAFPVAAKAAMRECGRQLLGLICRGAEGAADGALEEDCERLASAYAEWSRRHGVPADHMVRVLCRLRQAMVDAALNLAETETLAPQAVGGLLLQVHRRLDGIELALIRSGPTAAEGAGPSV